MNHSAAHLHCMCRQNVHGEQKKCDLRDDSIFCFFFHLNVSPKLRISRTRTPILRQKISSFLSFSSIQIAAKTPSSLESILLFIHRNFQSAFACCRFSWLQMIIINSRRVAHSTTATVARTKTEKIRWNKRKQKQQAKTPMMMMMKRESKIIISFVLCSVLFCSFLFFSICICIFFSSIFRLSLWERDEIVSAPARCVSNWCRWLTGAATFEIVVRLPQPAVFYAVVVVIVRLTYTHNKKVFRLSRARCLQCSNDYNKV